MQVLIAISGFCPRIGNVPCTTPFDLLFVISIHVPTWGTTLSISTNLFALIFQSTFPRGERHHQPGYHYLLHSFQSTFLCGERRHITRMQLTTLHFNPRSRVGNDGWSYSDRICDRDFNPHSCVGNDTKCEKKLRSYPDFNPRSLVGNDLFSYNPITISFVISIHVPSWGTTTEYISQISHDKIDFNPRSLVGNDCKFSQIFFVFLCNKYNFSTFYYPFSLFFSVIHVTFLIFVVRILPAFYVYF